MTQPQYAHTTAPVRVRSRRPDLGPRPKFTSISREFTSISREFTSISREFAEAEAEAEAESGSQAEASSPQVQ
eukprot:54987-Prorocentrum_minimum.AAC.1